MSEFNDEITGRHLFVPAVKTVLMAVILAVLVASFVCGARNAEAGSHDIHVGSELEFPPYAFVDESGQPAGFSVDLIRAVADAMGLSIRISTGPWDTVWNDLVAGRLDVLPLVAKLPERTRVVDFGLPHTETYDVFFVRKGADPIQNISAARGKEIVAMRSDAAHHALMEQGFQGRLILVNTIPEGLSLISSGKHDAFLCSMLTGTIAIMNHGLKGLVAGPPVPDYKRVFSFAVKKGDSELLEKLNHGLLLVKTNGEYDRIYEKWLIVDDPWKTLGKYLIPAVTIVIAVALIAGIWLVMLQRMVRKRTRELAETNIMLDQAREKLEERVEQRTNELRESNRALQNEIVERRKVEAEIRRSRDEWELTFNNVPDQIAILDKEYQIVRVNRTMAEMLGTSADKCVGLKCFACVHGSSSPPEFCPHTRSMEDGKEHSAELRESRFDRDFLVTTTPLIDDAGEIMGSVHVARDITERKKAEQQIRDSLEEKELLLREIHHRVKNNMTVIFSLLKLQLRHVRDERDRKLFEDSMARIKSMALIHEKLYRTGNLAEINFRDYILELSGSMFMSYRIPSGRIRLKTDVGNVSLGIDTAIPCGLIVNELLSNSMKYAFPDGTPGELRVSLHEISGPGRGDAGSHPASEIELIVGDNGIGMPEKIDIRTSDSLGLNLVNAFVKQLHGKIEISRANGTEFRIRFEKLESRGGKR